MVAFTKLVLEEPVEKKMKEYLICKISSYRKRQSNYERVN